MKTFKGQDYIELYEILKIKGNLDIYLIHKLGEHYNQNLDVSELISTLKSFLKKLIKQAALKKEEPLKEDIKIWKAILKIQSHHAFLDYFIRNYEGMWI